MEDVLTRSAITGTRGQENMIITISLKSFLAGSLLGPKDWTCPSSVPPACKARAAAPPPPPSSCLRLTVARTVTQAMVHQLWESSGSSLRMKIIRRSIQVLQNIHSRRETCEPLL